MKRIFDVLASLVGLAICSPLLLAVGIAIWRYDRGTPFYVASRAACGGGQFPMVKFRSMVLNADKLGGSSTAVTDRRITPIGKIVRAYKLDELIQLWNVLKGDMSLVGPRPQVPADAALYTDEEKQLLSIRPGITDIASIVFADEGDILRGASDPDLLYNQIIRPWKSRLALLYVARSGFIIDLEIICLTLIGLVSRAHSLAGVQRILKRWNADALLCNMARRDTALLPWPPPGAVDVVTECTR